MPRHKEGMEDGNPKGEMLPNYSEIHAVNRIHSSYELPDDERLAATKYVEQLIAQGVSPQLIDECIDGERKYARKDVQSQADAVRRAIANVEHYLKAAEEAAEEAAKEPKDNRDLLKK